MRDRYISMDIYGSHQLRIVDYHRKNKQSIYLYQAM